MSPLQTRLQAVAARDETVQQILSIAVTAEALSVALLGAALANRASLGLTDVEARSLTAARAEEQAHYAFLAGAGATPTTTTFTLPSATVVTSASVFFPTLIALEEIGVAAYLTASQQFACLGQHELAGVALQTGAIEAEHRAALRYFAIQKGLLSGVPNDVAFEKALFARMSEVPAALTSLGFLGGSGGTISYPGPGTIDATGVTQLQP